MSFLKGIYNKFVGTKVEKIDLSSFSGLAKLFSIELSTCKKKCIFTECSVHLIDNNKPFEYCIFVENLAPTNDKDMEYYFPISRAINL